MKPPGYGFRVRVLPDAGISIGSGLRDLRSLRLRPGADKGVDYDRPRRDGALPRTAP